MYTPFINKKKHILKQLLSLFNYQFCQLRNLIIRLERLQYITILRRQRLELVKEKICYCDITGCQFQVVKIFKNQE